MIIKTLVHTKDATDDVLAKEASAHFDQNPALQFQAEIFVEVRPWLSSEVLHKIFPTLDIMTALADRPDLRQVLTTTLAGLKPKAARSKSPEKQAELIDDSLGCEDISLADVEQAIAPNVWAIYVFGNKFWEAFFNEVLADIVSANGEREKKFITHFIDRSLLDRRCDGKDLKPILTHLDVAASLDPDTDSKWQKLVPSEKLSAVNRARRAQERKNPRTAFTTKQEIGIISIKTIVDSFDLTDFVPMIKAAGDAMGFGEEPFADLDVTGSQGQSPKA